MRITRITDPDGRVSTIKTGSTCGCVTPFLVLFVVAAPVALFPGPLAVVAYVVLGVIALAVIVGYALQARWLMKNVRRPAPPPPPAPAPPAP